MVTVAGMRWLLAVAALLPCLLACPQSIASLCRCEDLHNGVALNCSDSNGADVLQALKEHQSMIGLIQSLSLQRANIKQLPNGFFSGLYIKSLDLSYNNMEDMDDGAFIGMSPVLQDLTLHHNKLRRVPVFALGSLKTLLRLDLSNNTIGDIRAEDAMPALPKLFDINLGSNNISSIHKTAFEGVKNSLQTVNLGHNKLNSVPASAIRGFKQLQSLHMHRNNMSQLEALAFMNLPVLNLLNLAGNKITDINRQAFLNVPMLRYLYLTNNRIAAVLPHQFSSFEQLEMLDLTNNMIGELKTDAFSNVPQLRQLYMANNRISKIEKGVFTNSSIVILILSQNQLAELDEGIISGLAGLQQVSFKDNHIKTIHPNAFYDAPSIVMMDLGHNQLTDLAPSTFIAQLNLLLIDLSSNKIIRTPYAAFNRRVGTVLLQENPLTCTEKVHMLQDGVGVYIPTSEDIICGGKKAIPTTAAPTTTVASFVQSEQKPLHQLSIKPLRPAHTPSTDEVVQIPIRPVGVNEGSSAVVLQARPPVTRTRGNTGMGISNVDLAEQPEIDIPTPDLPTLESSSAEKSKELEIPPVVTSTLGPRVYTDIADNPNIIHPFPVPFLKRGPQMNRKAQRINYAASTTVASVDETTPSPHTLPPSIVISPRRMPSSSQNKEVEKNRIEEVQPQEFAMRPPSKAIAEEESSKASSTTSRPRLATPTTVIIICLCTVGIVMIGVFVGLCVARHRHVQRFGSSCSDSTAARTNAYVSAQAAQMNMIYGTLGRPGSSMSRPDEQPWIYTPGQHNYQSYYK